MLSRHLCFIENQHEGSTANSIIFQFLYFTIKTHYSYCINASEVLLPAARWQRATNSTLYVELNLCTCCLSFDFVGSFWTPFKARRTEEIQKSWQMCGCIYVEESKRGRCWREFLHCVKQYYIITTQNGLIRLKVFVWGPRER